MILFALTDAVGSEVGDKVGLLLKVGDIVGLMLGDAVGNIVGLLLGDVVGLLDGNFVGSDCRAVEQTCQVVTRLQLREKGVSFCFHLRMQ